MSDTGGCHPLWGHIRRSDAHNHAFPVLAHQRKHFFDRFVHETALIERRSYNRDCGIMHENAHEYVA